MKPPIFNINLAEFSVDPYPTLSRLRAEAPIALVPQLNATLFTKRADIFVCEKNVDVFSSEQPGGLMTRLMGHNMMRKDGAPHRQERKEAFPAFSPRTVADIWQKYFESDCERVISTLPRRFDLVREFAMLVSGHALRHITGLTNLSPVEMDAVSQAMIDGIANYAGDPHIEAACHAATSKIDAAIDETPDPEPQSLLSVLRQAGQADASIRANIKLAISGGQNEPRDAIAGAIWALLSHPEQLESLRSGQASYRQVFEEYARWIAPIGMSPREIAIDFEYNEIELKKGSRAFLMFGSANRDEDVFEHPEVFDIARNTGPAISFGAGPHFCAGAAASRVLISDVALPMLLNAMPKMRLDGEAPFSGWAFRGPISVPVCAD